VSDKTVSTSGKWWPLATVSLATFMLLLDITIVNVALPGIQAGLGATFGQLQWVIDAYALSLAALQLTSGSLGDRLGRKRLFIGGIVLFALASLACGLAPSATTLDVFRGIQGVGGAAMFATALALVGVHYQGRDRATAFSVWGAVAGASTAAGPVLGGVLTTELSWRWIFFLNLPLAVLAIAIAARVLRSARPDERRSVDVAGLVLFSVALVLLVYALVQGNSAGWASREIIGLLIGAAVLAAAFVAVELRQSQPMLPLRYFRRPGFVGAQIAGAALNGSLYALLLYLTLYLQDILGETALRAGLQLLVISGLSLIAAPIAGKLSDRIPYRLLLSGALVLTGVGIALMHGLSTASAWTALLLGFVLAGIGSGAVNPPLGSLAVSVVPQRESGVGSGTNNTFRQVGISAGIAVMGAIFAAHVSSELTRALPKASPGQIARLSGAVSSGGLQQALAHVPSAVRGTVAHAARASFVGGLNELFWIAAGIAIVGGLACLVLIRSRDLHQEPADGERQSAPTPERLVYGRVHDGERQPVAAAVTLIAAHGHAVDRVDTDPDGGYELRAQSGQYLLACIPASGRPYATWVTLDGGPVEVNPSLQES
jgi:EmrB/QacA subfamily drug resistance transporter